MAASLSQSLSTFIIPTAERSDTEEVRRSLALAHADFERGEVREALRHLRRAAESADDAGSELRGVALARAAADLATEVGTSLTPPPPSVAAPLPSVGAPVPSVAPPAPSVAPPSLTRPSNESALKQLLDSGRAVKVVVKRSARDEGLYVVRRAEGNAPALGAREAVMLLLDPDDAFFTPRKP